MVQLPMSTHPIFCFICVLLLCFTDMENWTVDDVCQWLRSIKIKNDSIALFKDEDVDGIGLTHFTLEELKNEMPDLKAGIRKRITVERDRYIQKELSQTSQLSPTHTQISPISDDNSNPSVPTLSKTDTSHTKSRERELMSMSVEEPTVEQQQNKSVAQRHLSETFRKFDTRPDIRFMYKRGSLFPQSDSRPGDLLQPLRRFVDICLDGSDESQLTLARESVAFICACMNERSNGTIYFGVSKAGQIQGTQLYTECKVIDNLITKILKHCFFGDQHSMIMSCVRPAKFIEVVPQNTERPEYVIEIDVVPKWEICGNEAFCVKLPQISKKKTKKAEYEEEAIFRYIDGKPELVVGKMLMNFMREKKEIADKRRISECEKRRPSSNINPELGKKLIELLYLDENADVYPIAVMNAPDKSLTKIFLKENFSFIKDIAWKAVFDFDPEARLQSYLEDDEEQITRIIPLTDDFNPRAKQNQRNPDRLKNIQEEIKTTSQLTWIFGNGYNRGEYPTSETPLEWKRTQSDGFKEAVRFFNSEIPNGRAIVVFFLLSKDYEVMLEAADEFCTVFQDQWVFVAETDNIAQPWLLELQHRNISDHRTITDRSVVGIPWNHVKEVVDQTKGPIKAGGCQLPTSYGTYCALTEKIKNEFVDLDILSATQCEDAEIISNQDGFEKFRKDVEEEFYRGGQICWWNYWCYDSVLQRSEHQTLLRMVRATLGGDTEDDNIGKVTLYHQPGAGGTTTARHILWDLKKEYRCAIIKNITDQTSEQILKFWSLQDTNPKPVVVLLDNLDEEKANILVARLEEKSKRIARHEISGDQVICVFLAVLRRSIMPRPKEIAKRIHLRHELTSQELSWFKRKHRHLEEDFEQAIGSDPKLLISFNILKENFDQEFIKRTVNEYVGQIESDKEKMLLKYIALINTFDLNFQPVPSSAFDNMMIDNPYSFGGIRYGLRAVARRWENKLSVEMKVLLNETSRSAMGQIKAFRIINPLLSKAILHNLMSPKEETVSMITLQFLNCKEVFSYKSLVKEALVNIMKGVVKIRARKPNGIPATQFAPLIQEIVDKENTEAASNVLKKCLELSQDPFIAQQIARLFIYEQNWDHAEEYAKKAISGMRHNSFLWDTCAQVYKGQLNEIYKTYVGDNRTMDIEDGQEMIRIALKAIETFQEEQIVSDEEKSTTFMNHAGFHGELEVIVRLLDCLNFLGPFWKQPRETLHQFLVNEKFIPAELKRWNNVDGKDLISQLKALQENVKKTVGRLHDEQIQLKDSNMDDYKRNQYHRQCDVLTKLKANLDSYYGENSDIVPDGLDQNEACQYRRRRLFCLGGESLRSIFEQQRVKGGEQTLVRIRNLIMQNIHSDHCNADDMQAMISVNLAFLSVHPEKLNEIIFQDMINWCRTLYRLRNTQRTVQLEPYLFYTMFNWPRRNIKYYVAPNFINEALRHWKDAYYRKYPRQREEDKPIRKKDTTIFFLAYGSDMASILNHESLKGSGGSTQMRDDAFWRQPHVLRQLHRFHGTLSNDGFLVNVDVEYGAGHKGIITIPTSFPITKRMMWNKTVYFVIGFR